MSIIPSLQNPNDLLLKLCRESINVYTSKNNEELMDCFFNFCVTAHSLRDWVIKAGNLNKDTVHPCCNSYESLRMCRDIANASKHFGLDDEKASSVSAIDEKELHYIPANPGKADPKAIIGKPSLEVVDQNGNKINLKNFMNDTIETWIIIFDEFFISRCQEFFYTGSLGIKVGKYEIDFF